MDICSNEYNAENKTANELSCLRANCGSAQLVGKRVKLELVF